MAATGKWGRAYLQDTAERVVASFITTLIPIWIAAGNVAHLDFADALELSASAAGLVLLKCILANLATGTPGAPSASIVGVTSNGSVDPAAPAA